jgi:hypothetical protein
MAAALLAGVVLVGCSVDLGNEGPVGRSAAAPKPRVDTAGLGIAQAAAITASLRVRDMVRPWWRAGGAPGSGRSTTSGRLGRLALRRTRPV